MIDMTELQKKEKELLSEFIRICDELELKYYLVCGSALGAVKYGGFIPWDDDIDVALLRGDYEKFCREAQKMLPRHMFLQNYKTDPEFPQIYSKLRNSETVCIERSAAMLGIHHGVCIDIFPLDGYPAGKFEAAVFEFKKSFYKRCISAAYEPEKAWKYIIVYPLRLMELHKCARRYTRLVMKYKTEGSDFLCNHGNWQGKLDYSPSEEFGEGVETVFEGLKVRIPSEYDGYLSRKYGEWSSLPTEEQRKSHHDLVTLDLERSYKEYYNKTEKKCK